MHKLLRHSYCDCGARSIIVATLLVVLQAESGVEAKERRASEADPLGIVGRGLTPYRGCVWVRNQVKCA